MGTRVPTSQKTGTRISLPGPGYIITSSYVAKLISDLFRHHTNLLCDNSDLSMMKLHRIDNWRHFVK